MHGELAETINEIQSKFSLKNINKEEMCIRIENLERIVLNYKFNKDINNHEKIQINRNKDYKSHIKDVLSATSLQFLLSPIRTKRLLIKIINTCFLILSVCLTIYLVTKNITEYLMYETTTSIKIIHEKNPEFPIVSFCLIGNSKYVNISLFWFNGENLTSVWKNYFVAFEDSSYRSKC